MFAPPPGGKNQQRNLPTMEVQGPNQHTQPPAAAPQKKGGMGKWIALLAAAAVVFLVLTVGGALVLFPGNDTGTISLRVAPEGADARVFVDGVQRGRAPLLLEHVPTGDRVIEIRADGYESLSRTVPVASGSTAMLEIAMTVENAAGPAIATAPTLPAAAAEPTAFADPSAAALEPAEPEVPAAAEPEVTPEPQVAPEPQVTPEPQPVRVATAPSPRPRTAPTDRTPRRVPRTTSPSPRPAPRPAPAASGGSQGSLTINTMPWARVFVDGRDTGRNTPVRNLRVSPGQHTIGLRTNDGTMHTVPVTIQPGESTRIVRRL